MPIPIEEPVSLYEDELDHGCTCQLLPENHPFIRELDHLNTTATYVLGDTDILNMEKEYVEKHYIDIAIDKANNYTPDLAQHAIKMHNVNYEFLSKFPTNITFKDAWHYITSQSIFYKSYIQKQNNDAVKHAKHIFHKKQTILWEKDPFHQNIFES